jgi:hypothetical protein
LGPYKLRKAKERPYTQARTSRWFQRVQGLAVPAARESADSQIADPRTQVRGDVRENCLCHFSAMTLLDSPDGGNDSLSGASQVFPASPIFLIVIVIASLGLNRREAGRRNWPCLSRSTWKQCPIAIAESSELLVVQRVTARNTLRPQLWTRCVRCYNWRGAVRIPRSAVVCLPCPFRCGRALRVPHFIVSAFVVRS